MSKRKETIRADRIEALRATGEEPELAIHDGHVHVSSPRRLPKQGDDFDCTAARPFDASKAGEKAWFVVYHDSRMIDCLLVCRHCHSVFDSHLHVVGPRGDGYTTKTTRARAENVRRLSKELP